MKKLLISLLIFLTGISFANAAESFQDIESHWAKETIQALVNEGIIGGYADGTFRPNNPVTTAEFIKLAMEAAGIKGNYTGQPWYQNLLDQALELGIIDGQIYGQPNEPIKRKDMAKVLVALIERNDSLKADLVPPNQDYDRFKYLLMDTYQLPQAERTAIYKLFEYGLTVGTTIDEKVYYYPKSNLSRAEVATIVERLINPEKRADQFANYPNRVSVLNDESLHDHISWHTFDADHENKRLLLKSMDYDFENYVLEEKLNPNINRQLYELTRVLVGPERYVYISPIVNAGSLEIDNEDARVIVRYSAHERAAINGYDAFSFILQEKKGYNVKEDSQTTKPLSTNSIISLHLGNLWDTKPNPWSTPFFEEKLKNSLIALFGEANGMDIYKYVLESYLTKRNNPEKRVLETKRFGNIQVDYVSADYFTGHGAKLYFNFSYID